MLVRDARLRADGQPIMTPEAAEEFRRHAEETYPEECVGWVNMDGAYHRLANIATDRERTAVIEPWALIEPMKAGTLRAFCHSHPDGPDAPSEQDMRSQIEMEVPFVIISTNGSASLPAFAWGDELLDERELVGRPFRHGVDDCYGLIRAWYRVERNVSLGDYPRNWEWWNEGTEGEKDLYRRYFAEQGFREVDRSDMREGDVFLAAIRSDVPNHAGIYLGEGLMIHHASSRLAFDPSRLSRREPLVRWAPYITHWLRRSPE